jgi:hypothetical protein
MFDLGARRDVEADLMSKHSDSYVEQQGFGWSLILDGSEPRHERVVGKFATRGEAMKHARAIGLHPREGATK